ncbi:hypothetical protein BJ742DRAFT_865366 [Cladochytrium replicatum]|nr:hypothetical protein BJ742DRAFT_865366 [Cladochytrium replicatum]
MRFLAITAALSAASLVSGQTIADLVTGYGTTPSGNVTLMSRVAALVASNPAWASAGTHTLFASVDSGYTTLNSAIPGNTGVLFFQGTAVDWTSAATPKYLIVRDASNDPVAVYDNYNSGLVSDLHVRTGTEDVTAIASVKATNGVLVVLSRPVNKLSTVTGVLAGTFGTGKTAFRNAIVTAGLQSTIDNLAGCTFLVPNDTVWNAASAQLSGLTPQQLAYVIFNHIVPTTTYSTLLGATLNTFIGTSLPVALTGGETVTLGGGTIDIPADITSRNGPIHSFGRVLIPSPIPANPTLPAIPAANQLAPSSTTTTATAAPTAAATAAATTAATTSKASPTSAAHRLTPGSQTAGPFVAITVFALLATVFAL